MAARKIGIIGGGNVGSALERGPKRDGREVEIRNRAPSSLL
jgi:prephenate dehydrogenase